MSTPTARTSRAGGAKPDPENGRIADRLRRMATLLSQQDANPFRISAYERAADTVDGLPQSLRELAERGGREALIELPGIGQGIAGAIDEMLRTDRWLQLERLNGEFDPERLFRAIPGIGPKLARAIHDELDVDSLEGLEMAAHDGRLEAVPGVGRRRADAIRSSLHVMLGKTRRQRSGGNEADTGIRQPDVALLLAVDKAYRNAADSDRLPRIAPKRFNPTGEAWLPVLHTEREGWHFTALFSNTARAHQLGRTRDWVVIYYYDQDHREGQRTIVTERRGTLAGRRVVRGRESACRAHYGLPDK